MTATATATATATVKPAQIWAALAQCAPKAFKSAFIENAEALSASYTGPKQLKNALERVQAEYGLKPVFGRMLKSCARDGATVEGVFMEAVASMLDAPKPKAPKAEASASAVLEASASAVLEALASGTLPDALRLRLLEALASKPEEALI